MSFLDSFSMKSRLSQRTQPARFVPKAVASARFVSSFVNSLTALSAELEGRHYGGGVLELVPSEINRLIVPIASLDRSDLNRLNRQFQMGVGTEEIFDTQDDHVLKSIGISKNDIADIQAAAWRLRRRRLRTATEPQISDDTTADEVMSEDILVQV